VLGLDFKHKTFNTLSKTELQTLPKGMKVFEFSGTRDWKLGSKSRPDMIDKISRALDMPMTELMMEDESDDEVRAACALWKELQRKPLLGNFYDFDNTSDGLDDSDDSNDHDLNDIDGLDDDILDSRSKAPDPR
jgi:hypothetical protein